MKKLSLLVLVTTILLGCGSSSSTKSDELPTTFATCDELKNIVQYHSYSDLKTKWGIGEVAEPWDASGTGEMDMKVKVKWYNIKCNGRAVEIMFTNAHSGVADAFEKTPNLFDGIFCDEYKTPYVEPKSETPSTQNETKVEENIKPVEPTPQVEVTEEIIKTGTATANVTRAYFYDKPNINTIRKQYIVKTQSINFTNSENGFIYGSYTNPRNQITTEGWMLISDFTISSTQ